MKRFGAISARRILVATPQAVRHSQPMSRVTALLIVTAVWAAIYLPALGSLEIKGEEGRRILPAVTMLESGNYIVPRVGSTAYFSKPPLINWVVAASFEIFGQRNESTARLPSAFCVLAVAVAFVTVARASLWPTGSVFAALIWLTNFGMIEKGRLIEIEALYVSLCGLAIIFWLSFWEQNKSPWLVWIPASIFREVGDVQMVKAILRAVERRGFQIFQLDPQSSAQPRLSSAVASFVAVLAPRKIFV